MKPVVLYRARHASVPGAPKPPSAYDQAIAVCNAVNTPRSLLLSVILTADFAARVAGQTGTPTKDRAVA